MRQKSVFNGYDFERYSGIGTFHVGKSKDKSYSVRAAITPEDGMKEFGIVSFEIRPNFSSEVYHIRVHNLRDLRNIHFREKKRGESWAGSSYFILYEPTYSKEAWKSSDIKMTKRAFEALHRNEKQKHKVSCAEIFAFSKTEPAKALSAALLVLIDEATSKHAPDSGLNQRNFHAVSVLQGMQSAISGDILFRDSIRQ